MNEQLTVWISASDSITQAGLEAQLRGARDVRVIDAPERDSAAVVLLCAERVDDDVVRSVRALQHNGCERIVLVLNEVDEGDVLAAVEAGVMGLLRRSATNPEQLATTIRAAAAGEGMLPPDLLGRLLRQVRQVQSQVLGPRGFRLSGLSDRELSVLRLVADGCDTREIADELCYSERTIKNVIQDVTRRFGLRNRSHAVAYVLRQGLI
jgi:DNA-binding NarL/FixJ family response regulator